MLRSYVKSAQSPSDRANLGPGPLRDIHIVEAPSPDCPLAVALSLAFAGRLAADLGAKVTVVGAAAQMQRRAILPAVQRASALSQFLDAGKTDWSAQPHVDADLGALLGAADVILCDPPAHLASGRLAEQAIWTLVSTRPDADAGFDSEFTLLAASGLLDLVGDPARRPLRLGGHQLAYAAGLSIYSGFLAALCGRKAGVQTGLVRVNLADVGVWLNWKSVAMSTWSTREATRLGDDAEWRTVRCADGWTAVVYLEADWPVLRDMINDPRLADPRFDDRSVRRANAALITGVVEEYFSRLTRTELRQIALDNRIPLGPVWSPAELEHDPQYLQRDFLHRVSVEGGDVLRPRAPVVWNGQRFGAEAGL